jgi:hypothetical protein
VNNFRSLCFVVQNVGHFKKKEVTNFKLRIFRDATVFQTRPTDNETIDNSSKIITIVSNNHLFRETFFSAKVGEPVSTGLHIVENNVNKHRPVNLTLK